MYKNQKGYGAVAIVLGVVGFAGTLVMMGVLVVKQVVTIITGALLVLFVSCFTQVYESFVGCLGGVMNSTQRRHVPAIFIYNSH